MPDPKPTQREVAINKQQKQPKPAPQGKRDAPCQIQLNAKKPDSEHKCTGCGQCGKSKDKGLSPSSGISLDLASLEGATFSVSSEPTQATSEPEVAVEDKPHVCTGCGACGSSATLKDAAAFDLSSLQDQKVTLEKPLDSAPAKENPLGKKPEGSSLEVEDKQPLQAEPHSFQPHSTVHTDSNSPHNAQPDVDKTSKSQEATPNISQRRQETIQDVSFLTASFERLWPTFAPRKDSPAPIEQERVSKSSDVSGSQIQGTTQSKSKDVYSHKTQAPKKQYIIGTYTYQDILASAWLRKMYGHLVGLGEIQNPRAEKLSSQEPTQKSKASIVPLDKQKTKISSTSNLEEKGQKTDPKIQELNESAKEAPKEKLLAKLNIPNLKQEMVKATKKAGELKEELRKLKLEAKGLKIQHARAATVAAKKAVSKKIEELAQKQQELKEELGELKTYIKSLKLNLTIREAKQVLGKAPKKAAAAIEKLISGKELSLTFLKQYTKEELLALKKLLENKKIIFYLLLHQKEKKRKNALLKRISELLKTISRILGG